jgi:hypothetical protein
MLYGGMQRLARILLFLIATTALRAIDTLAQARYAQQLLGPRVWSQVIHVENKAVGTLYPREVHALIFELEDVLWFYTALDGTQSFSVYRGRLVQDKADFAPLLGEIEPGFGAWRVVPDEPVTAAKNAITGKLENGCFIESIAALRERLARGEAIGRPRLLSYYVDGPRGRKGHTVLAYELSDGLRVFDPAKGKGPRTFSGALGGDPEGLARAVFGRRVSAARWLPLDSLVEREQAAGLMAADPSPMPHDQRSS